jgi:Tol biopolymer transport system component
MQKREPGRRVAEPGTVDSPVWAPDSSKLVFERAYDSPPKLFLRGLGDQDADEPLPPEYFQEPTDWSRDGRFIAWTNTSFAQMKNEMQGEVWLLDMPRQRRAIRLSGTSNHEASPAFPPDGRWLASTSDESGRTEVYVQALEAGETPRLVGESAILFRETVRSVCGGGGTAGSCSTWLGMAGYMRSR